MLSITQCCVLHLHPGRGPPRVCRIRSCLKILERIVQGRRKINSKNLLHGHRKVPERRLRPLPSDIVPAGTLTAEAQHPLCVEVKALHYAKEAESIDRLRVLRVLHRVLLHDDISVAKVDGSRGGALCPRFHPNINIIFRPLFLLLTKMYKMLSCSCFQASERLKTKQTVRKPHPDIFFSSLKYEEKGSVDL